MADTRKPLDLSTLLVPDAKEAEVHPLAVSIRYASDREAIEKAAPEMLALLRWAAATDQYESPEMHSAGELYAGQWMEKVKALLARLPKEGCGG